LMSFLSFIPCWMLMFFFFGASFFPNLTLCMTKLRVLVLCFFLLRRTLLESWHDLFSLIWDRFF
jgi:hypothetical protein